MASPIPLEAPVTRAARSGMGESNLSSGFGRGRRRAESKQAVARRTIDRCRSPSSLTLGADPGRARPRVRRRRRGRRAAAAAAGSGRPDHRAGRARARAARSRATPTPQTVTRGAGARGGRSRRSTRTTRRARRRADAELLALLGLLPPGTDLGAAIGGHLRAGRGRLLRPALGPDADRRGRADRQPRALRDDRRARAQPRAGGPALRLRPRAAGASGDDARWPTARSSRAARRR